MNGRLVFLDGLRGWAAVVVVFSHMLNTWMLNRPMVESQHAAGLLDLINRTPLGVFMDGTQAVYIFFCISGCALSYPLLNSRRRYFDLGVMALNRYPRLTIPILVSCSIAFVLLASGLMFNKPAGELSHSQGWLSSFYQFPADIAAMLKFVFWDVYFNYQPASAWNNVLWTMTTELTGSFVLFVWFAILPSRKLQFWVVGVLAAVSLPLAINGFFSGWALALLLVELNKTEPTKTVQLQRTLIGAALLLLALAGATLVRAVPTFMSPAPNWTVEFWPKNIVAALTVAGVALCAPMRAALQVAPSRFVGRLSFSLYLVHLIVICSLSSWLFTWLVHWRLPYWQVVGIIVAETLVVAFAVAYVFALLVEERLVPMTKALIKRLLTLSLRAAQGASAAAQ